jgi:hypothetical protein
MGKKITKQEFIHRSNQIHNFEYDYSLVDYKNNKTSVSIKCKIHGLFNQRPINHINGKSGCPFCYGHIKSSLEEFIVKSNQIHNFKYDYSIVDYKNNKTKVSIICNEHGIFKQSPNVHLSGHGCFICANKNDISNFIKKSIEIYGDIYDYSNSIYKNIYSDIKIKCKIHGEFTIKPSHFLYEKNGCPYCSKNRYKNLDFFIDDANRIHNNKYKYELIKDLNKLSYINIICPIHGKFIQRIDSHISGNGCANCNESKGESKICEFLDKNGIKFKRQFIFEGCKNKQNLPFDFYLIDYNMCIEYDGEQHFNPIQYFGGPKKLQEIRINDSIKNKFCLDNEIKIVRISYLNYDKIEPYLDSILS